MESWFLSEGGDLNQLSAGPAQKASPPSQHPLPPAIALRTHSCSGPTVWVMPPLGKGVWLCAAPVRVGHWASREGLLMGRMWGTEGRGGGGKESCLPPGRWPLASHQLDRMAMGSLPPPASVSPAPLHLSQTQGDGGGAEGGGLARSLRDLKITAHSCDSPVGNFGPFPASGAHPGCHLSCTYLCLPPWLEASPLSLALGSLFLPLGGSTGPAEALHNSPAAPTRAGRQAGRRAGWRP